MESSGSEEVGPEEGGSNFTGLIIALIVNFIVLPGLLCLYCKFYAYCQGDEENFTIEFSVVD